MKKFTFIGKLASYERRNNSYYGNPKYWGCFENAVTGETLSGITASNAACAYQFLNYQDKPREVTYHITKNGNTIIDYIKILE